MNFKLKGSPCNCDPILVKGETSFYGNHECPNSGDGAPLLGFLSLFAFGLSLKYGISLLILGTIFLFFGIYLKSIE